MLKNVIESLTDSIPMEIDEEKVIGNLWLLTVGCQKKTAAFLGRNLPTVVRLTIFAQIQPAKIHVNKFLWGTEGSFF